MKEIVGIQFKNASRVYYFSPLEYKFKVGEHAIVETVRGLELGKVIIANRNVEDDELSHELKPVIRKANNHDLIIVDPLNNQNNVAKSTFQYMNIKMAFMIAFMVSKEDCECGCHYDVLPNKTVGTEHCILKRIFNSVKRFSAANKQNY